MNENQKKEIAKFSVLYLKNRMMIKQKLISSDEGQIKFESFMAIYNKYLKIIDYVEEHPSEIIDSNDEQISFGEKVNRIKNNFVRTNAAFIVMTEEEIDEMMNYIKESIELYGLQSKDFYNETFFVREVLSQFVNKMAEDDKKKERVETFLVFSRVSEHVGFCEALEGKISYDNNKFYISNYNFTPVCRINLDGINEVNDNELENEDILIADNLYIGNLTNVENMNFIFLEKIVKGQRKMKAISYDQKIYDIYGEKNQIDKVTTIGRAFLYDKINKYFENMGFPCFNFKMYTKDSLYQTLNAFNKFNNMSLDERNELEQVIEIAISWWIDNFSFSSFESGIEGQIGENLNLLAPLFANNKFTLKEKQIKKFKEILGSMIRVSLLSKSICGLYVDYRPEGELAIAIKESQLNASFPIKTNMTITKDKIEVRKGYSAPVEIIYSKTMDTSIKK